MDLYSSRDNDLGNQIPFLFLMILPQTIKDNMPVHCIILLFDSTFPSVLVGKAVYAREKGHGIFGGKKKKSVDHLILFSLMTNTVVDGSSVVNASACNAGYPGSILGSGRSPGEGNGNPLQYSCLENPMDGGAWWATQSTESQRVGRD